MQGLACNCAYFMQYQRCSHTQVVGADRRKNEKKQYPPRKVQRQRELERKGQTATANQREKRDTVKKAETAKRRASETELGDNDNV